MLNQQTNRRQIGSSGVFVPELIFGTSSLGNLYTELDAQTKQNLVAEWFRIVDAPVCIDSAGKYGAGLALEEAGRAMRALAIPADDVIVSNKLGWKRIALTEDEPRFEPGVWKNLRHDAIQAISYDGILECWRQGNDLLGGEYQAKLLSVHDPDEYLASATDTADRRRRLHDIHDAYRALEDLKRDGHVAAVGIGAKDWRVIRELSDTIDFDWVMLAGSLTIHNHPDELIGFVEQLERAEVFVINSAVFNAGFLVGGDHYDYRRVSRTSDAELFAWRDRFNGILADYHLSAADACVEYGLAPHGVQSVAMNTSRPERVGDNLRAVQARAPSRFWEQLLAEELISVTPERLR